MGAWQLALPAGSLGSTGVVASVTGWPVTAAAAVRRPPAVTADASMGTLHLATVMLAVTAGLALPAASVTQSATTCRPSKVGVKLGATAAASFKRALPPAGCCKIDQR